MFSRSDDYLELQDVSDGESSIIVSGYSRLQSRLNPVPESLNSPDIVPGITIVHLRQSLFIS